MKLSEFARLKIEKQGIYETMEGCEILDRLCDQNYRILAKMKMI